MVLRMVGAGMIIAASGGLGVYGANQWTRHLKSLEQLQKAILLLKGEILYAHAPLEEACLRVGEKMKGSLGGLFLAVSERIRVQIGEPFYDMWKQEVESLGKEALLSGKDKQDLIAFGEHLGYLDLEMQERTILLYLEELERSISYLREHQRERSRLYTSLGFMGGLFLTIIMY